MTIRHPAKVKIVPENILASGVDTLVLSMDVGWNDPSLFPFLDELKEQAKECGADYPGELKHPFSPDPWPFTIKPHGTQGFSWILSSSAFTFKIAHRTEPGQRPGVMIEFRSEGLWHMGAAEAIRLAMGIITANGGTIVETKLSRVDLCIDVLVPEELWDADLLTYAVTRASDYAPYYRNRQLTGIRIGKGVVSARLYDKPLEIAQQSKKIWMHDIWGIPEVPEGKKIIRVEFQMRREVLKELGLNTPHTLLEKSVNGWAYCTKEWLKFQDRPGLHHTQRKTFQWWEAIQQGFSGVQDAEPLVREQAVCMEKKRLLQQMNGLTISLHAIRQEQQGAALNTPASLEDCVVSYAEELSKSPDRKADIQSRLDRKRARYHHEMVNRDKRVHKMAHTFSDS